MNNVNLTGRWTKDIDLKFLPGNGTAIAKGTLAINRRFKKEGQPEADFLPIVIWKKQAENTANFCGKKGDLIGIRGRIETRNYENKDGNRVYITEVTAEEVEFLNFKSKGNSDNNSSSSNSYNSNDSFKTGDYSEDLTPMDDGDIPF
ncbi:single-stranded DNA-binding protein [Clostridium sp. DL1XJH146]